MKSCWRFIRTKHWKWWITSNEAGAKEEKMCKFLLDWRNANTYWCI